MLLLGLGLVTGIAGWGGAPWWAALAGSCLIALILFQEDLRVLPPRGQEASWELAETLTNILLGGLGGVVAFTLGRMLGVLI